MSSTRGDLAQLTLWLFGWLFVTRFGNLVLCALGIAALVLGVQKHYKPIIYVGIPLVLLSVGLFAAITLKKRRRRAEKALIKEQKKMADTPPPPPPPPTDTNTEAK